MACHNGVSRRAFVLGGMFGVKGSASSHRWSLCRIRSVGWGRLMLEIRWYTSFWMLDFGCSFLRCGCCCLSSLVVSMLSCFKLRCMSPMCGRVL